MFTDYTKIVIKSGDGGNIYFQVDKDRNTEEKVMEEERGCYK